MKWPDPSPIRMHPLRTKRPLTMPARQQLLVLGVAVPVQDFMDDLYFGLVVGEQVEFTWSVEDAILRTAHHGRDGRILDTGVVPLSQSICVAPGQSLSLVALLVNEHGELEEVDVPLHVRIVGTIRALKLEEKA